ncbi:MAG: hypothetical protein OSA98_08805 [Rubripirellula sp.]|nr:hypothetical protein [Rubripirellula sp.]
MNPPFRFRMDLEHENSEILVRVGIAAREYQIKFGKLPQTVTQLTPVFITKSLAGQTKEHRITMFEEQVDLILTVLPANGMPPLSDDPEGILIRLPERP